MEIDGRGRTISTAILYDVLNAMRDLEPDEETSVRTVALPAVDSDVRAWCRTVGHELTGVEERKAGAGVEARSLDSE